MNLVSKLCKNARYSICFINPVPFQTSLFYIHKESISKKITVIDSNTNKEKEVEPVKDLRDKVWNQLFPLFEDKFLDLIEKIQPVIILNACTKDLKPKVSDTINKAIKHRCVGIFNTHHPSAPQWTYKSTNLCSLAN